MPKPRLIVVLAGVLLILSAFGSRAEEASQPAPAPPAGENRPAEGPGQDQQGQQQGQGEQQQRRCQQGTEGCPAAVVVVVLAPAQDLYRRLAYPESPEARGPLPARPDPATVRALAEDLLSRRRSGERLSDADRRVAAALPRRYPDEFGPEEARELEEAGRRPAGAPALRDPFEHPDVFQALFTVGDLHDAPAARLGYQTAATRLPPPPELGRISAFTRPDGSTASLEELSRGGGQVVLVFACRTCPACNSQQTAERVEEVRRRLGPNASVALVLERESSGGDQEVFRRAREKGIPVATLSVADIQGLGVSAYPSMRVLGSDGALRPVDGAAPSPSPSSPGSVSAPQDTVVKIEVSGAAGSATLVWREGGTYYALTADHVTEGRRVLRLTRSNGQVVPARNLTVVAHGPGDVSLVRFESSEELPVSPIAGRGYQPTVSQPVLMAGYPRAGQYVQDSAHLFRYFRDLLSTDRNTISGMSGGGLFDVNGQVIGVCNVGGPCGGYAPLGNIHAMLDQAGLSRIYQGGATRSPPADAPHQAWWRTVGYQLALARAAGGGPGGRPGDPLGGLFDGSGRGRGPAPGPPGGEPGVPVGGPSGPGGKKDAGKAPGEQGKKDGDKGQGGGEKKEEPRQAGGGCAASASAEGFDSDRPYEVNVPFTVLVSMAFMGLRKRRRGRKA